MKQALLIFAKNLIYGKVKTRLAATLGNDAALSVYQVLLKSTMVVTSYLPFNKIVFYSDYVEAEDIWDHNIYKKQLQVGDHLGKRMRNAFLHAFNEGNEIAVIIGTDCPGINSEIIMNAFANLNTYDIVIGPAKDGGYYLLGMKKLHEELFENIGWSSSFVLKQTIDVCRRQNLSHYYLPVLSDVDEEKDLVHLNINP